MPALTGIGDASTFTGFCSVHDNAIFRPLEDREFTGTREQCFLLAYRAFAREVFTKRIQEQSVGIMREADRGKSLADQLDIQSLAGAVGEGVQAALDDHAKLKPMFDDILVAGDFSQVRAYLIEFHDPPPVMCSGADYPEQDFEGNKLQDLSNYDRLPHMLGVNSFYSGSTGAVVFTWLSRDDETCIKFIESLDRVAEDDLAGALVRLMFEHFENVCIRPDWWESLSEQQRLALNQRMTQSAIPWNAREPRCLVDDGLGIPSWPVKSRRWLRED